MENEEDFSMLKERDIALSERDTFALEIARQAIDARSRRDEMRSNQLEMMHHRHRANVAEKRVSELELSLQECVESKWAMKLEIADRDQKIESLKADVNRLMDPLDGITLCPQCQPLRKRFARRND